MKNQLRLFVLIGSASLAAAAGLLVACSDDTSVNASTDGGPTFETGTSDSPVIDGGSNTDTGADAPFDGGFVLDTFDEVLATELCNSLSRCCYGTAAPAEGGADGGTFDMAACRTQYGRLGFEGSNVLSEIKDGGNVTLDQAAADNCIMKVKAVSCNLGGAEFKAIRSACFGAYAGKLAGSATCKDSIECQPGSFCKIPGDAGTGACTPLRAVNGPCGDYTDDPARGDEACSYRRGGPPTNYCSFYDFDAGAFLPPAQWKCAAPVANGSTCATSLWCDQGICADPGTCQSPDKYFDPTCQSFLVP
jgi:hypothetical protein